MSGTEGTAGRGGGIRVVQEEPTCFRRSWAAINGDVSIILNYPIFLAGTWLMGPLVNLRLILPLRTDCGNNLPTFFRF